jgi:signal peptidase I
MPLSGLALMELARAVLGRGIPFRFQARGFSMTPFVRDGDVITISPLHKGQVRIGEIVAFVRPGERRLVVHRVVVKRSTVFLIQGDGDPHYTDENISIDDLLGRVTRVERNSKNIWLGLGAERIFIAWLSYTKLLLPLRGWLVICRKRISRRWG